MENPALLLKAHYLHHTPAFRAPGTFSRRNLDMHPQAADPRTCYNQPVVKLLRPAHLKRNEQKTRYSPVNLNFSSLEGILWKVGKDYLK